MFILINLVVDLLYSALDPRVRLGGDMMGASATATVQDLAPGARPRRFSSPTRSGARRPPQTTHLAAGFARSKLAVAALAFLVADHRCSRSWRRRSRRRTPTTSPQIDLMDAQLEPGSPASAGHVVYVLGTDGQGRDMLSAILYGLRVSLVVGVASGVIALAIGASLGILAAYVGGRFEQLLMRARRHPARHSRRSWWR